MSSKIERGVRQNEPQVGRGRPPLDWNNAKLFLEISRHKSLRAAAIALNQSVNGLRHHLDKLEKDLGVSLFTRHVDGLRLTAEGERVIGIAERMEQQAFELVRATGSGGPATRGRVRLAITEGLGSLWIGARLVDFLSANPEVAVDMQCAMATADVLRLQAELAVQLVAPAHKDLRTVRLGRLHTMPFASQAYLEANGVPQSVADLATHRLVVQLADQVTRPETFAEIFPDAPLVDIVMSTNGSLAHYAAVAQGVGIGMLPTYVYPMARAAGIQLTPIDVGYRTQHDIWLVCHADTGRIPRVRRLMDWMIEVFSARNGPWFADAFVNPADLPDTPMDPLVAAVGKP